jgi:biopolymer transport protein TolQ
MRDPVTAVPTASPTTIVDTVQLAGTAAQHDLSPLGLFLQADLVVQSVMIILLLASLWSWAIVFDKLMRLKQLRQRAERFEDQFWNEASLDNLYDRVQTNPPDPLAAVFVAGMKEWRTSTASGRVSGNLSTGLKERVERVMGLTAGREVSEIEKDMTFLATLGSSAPFIGLFGTVWGIMNSFTAIAGQQDTSLAVVAPGIAEALFATAMGLVAAIPAVIFYNRFANEIGRYSQRVQDFADQFATILSRRLDERV